MLTLLLKRSLKVMEIEILYQEAVECRSKSLTSLTPQMPKRCNICEKAPMRMRNIINRAFVSLF